MTPLVLIIVGLALAVGLLAAWPFLRRRSEEVPPGPLAPDTDIRTKLEAHYRGLTELDEEFAMGKLSAEDHARLKGQLEQAAAALLARVEAPAPTLAEPARRRARATTRPVPESGSPRFVVGPALVAGGAASLVLLGVGLGVLLPRVLTSPSAAAPSPPLADRSAPLQTGLESELQRTLEADPPDVKRFLALGHQALDQGRGSQAARAYKRVLDVEPKNVEALTHVGTLLFQAGYVDQALSHLDRALALDPTYAHALWDKAQILYQAKQDYAGAIQAWEVFLAVVPSGDDADRVRAMIAEAKGRALVPTATGREPPTPEAASR